MKRIAQAPPDSGRVELGRTLPSLLEQARIDNPNPTAFNQRTESGWEPLSTEAFQRRARHLALGLRDAGLEPGDRVALFTESDLSFCLGDMGCLIGGLIDVPIYLTHSESAMRHILGECQARALITSDAELYGRIAPVLERMIDADDLDLDLVAFWSAPETMPELPAGVRGVGFDELEARGEEIHADDPDRIEAFENALGANDLATVLYTSGTTGLPKGVMLSHENISSNAIAAFSGADSIQRGPAETTVSFLPLTHIFARTLHYCNVWYGTSVYFSHPDRLRDDLQEVAPTFFASVPRVLEKAYERIRATGASLGGVKRVLFDWSMGLAESYSVEDPPGGFEAVQRKLADRLVFSKWREALGGRIHTMVVGGAALRPELVNAFGAADIHILQGYGLTETSPVIAFNRPGFNRAGTVGPALAGTEMAIDDDDEVLARGPHIMLGYYKQPDLTAEAIDDDGWFHTGDLGTIDDRGYLTITGRKKNLFKLSTGKYVMPQPIEDELEGEPTIDVALVVGEGEKYCAALVFVAQDALEDRGVDDPELQREVRDALRRANGDLPPWSVVKRAALLTDELTIDNGALTPKMSVKRGVVLERYEHAYRVLYGHTDGPLEGGTVIEVAERPAATAA